MKPSPRPVKPRAAASAAPLTPSPRIIAPRHIALVTSLSPTTVWRLRRQHRFPEPVRLSVGRVGWRRRDIEKWLAEREAAAR